MRIEGTQGVAKDLAEYDSKAYIREAFSTGYRNGRIRQRRIRQCKSVERATKGETFSELYSQDVKHAGLRGVRMFSTRYRRAS